MRHVDALRVLAELATAQWGMVTSAQAGACGVTRLELSRLAEAGQLTRLAHGIYKAAGAPGDEFEDLRAAWLSTDPRVMGEVRIRDLAHGVVIAGASAALLHGIGDLWANQHDFVAPNRRQSQRPQIRYRRRVLDARDITLVQGLPVMTVERTIADLVEIAGDLSLVADALRDACLQRSLDMDRLSTLLSPLAGREGFDKGDGTAFLNRLLEIACLDTESVARYIAADRTLGPRVAADYFRRVDRPSLEQFTLSAVQDSIVEIFQNESLAQCVELKDTFLNDGWAEGLAHQILSQLVNRDRTNKFTQARGGLMFDDIALTLEYLSVARQTKRVITGD